MANKSDILLQMIQEQWAQARQSEEQRAAMTNYILIIAGAMTGFLVNKSLDRTALPLTIFLILLGVFGVVMSAKYRERFYFHIHRIHVMTARLDELNPEINTLQLYKTADREHHARFPRLEPFPTYALWVALHISITITGVATSVIAIIK